MQRFWEIANVKHGFTYIDIPPKQRPNAEGIEVLVQLSPLN